MSVSKHHRKKCVRLNSEDHAHELTFACYRNQPFLNNLATCTLFAEAINVARIRHNFHVWAYVFMPDHVHLFIFPLSQTYSVSAILKAIKQPVSRNVIRDLKGTGSDRLKRFATGNKSKPYRFWQQGGGYDRNITSPEVLRASVDYIHNNPVRKDLAAYAEDWRWSSAGTWKSGEPGPVMIDTESFPLL